MLTIMYNYLLGLVQKEEGQGMVEYALLVALIAIVVIAGLSVLGPAIKVKFLEIVNHLG